MMTFLNVLKIIGIVLLVLVVLVVVLLAAILLVTCFWPFGYELIVTKHETFDALARVHWLFRILKIDVWYEDGLQAQAKVFGKVVYDLNAEDEAAEPESDDAAEPVSDNSSTAAATEDKTEIVSSEEPEKILPAEEECPKLTSAEQDKKNEEKSKRKRRARKKSLGRKLDEFFNKIDTKLDEVLDFLIDLPEKADGLIDKAVGKADEIVDTIDYYYRLMTSSGTEYVWEVTKKRIGAILKQFIPKKLDLKLDYRNDDPCKVVKVWQYYAISLPIIDMIPGKVEVTSEQTEEPGYELDTKISGRFYLGPILWHAGIWYMDKKVRGFIRRAKREGK
ncbi:MAG: hypothetical protein K6A72_11040 [Lachnospiraceae bacterium]|nr:hypothetical protein [Lachnospiraceae bacterium]